VVSCREEVTPHLLRVLETFPERWAAGEVEEDEMLHDYSMHLLAEFREPRAYRSLVRIARMPEADAVLGDTVADGLSKLLAAVWAGDMAPMLELIGDPMADEFARASGLSAIGVLFRNGDLERTQLLALLEEIDETDVDKQPIYLWNAWTGMAADFRLEEMLDRVRALFNDGLADPGVEPLNSLEVRLLGGKDSEWELSKYRFFTTASNEMGWWHCFSEAAAREESAEPATAPDRADYLGQQPQSVGSPYVPPQPFRRESFKVGRNDPCPCGSGKKFKKCCSD